MCIIQLTFAFEPKCMDCGSDLPIECSPNKPKFDAIRGVYTFSVGKCQNKRCTSLVDTDSPKLPTLEEVIEGVSAKYLPDYYNRTSSVVEATYEFICRQLLADT